MQVGQLSENVTVSADTPMLQTDRAEVRSELKARELVNLPVSLNRNYQYLFRVLPGFTPPAEAHSVPSNPSRALVFNVNGASRSSNNIRIDGVSTTNIWLPHVAAYVPALESLETVNVVTSSFDAEQGLAGGSAINVQIKSGTNQIHGSAFEYHTNEHLRTQNYFAPAGTPKGNWKYNQYGGTSGGPIVRNKLFYFVSYEGTRDQQNLTRTVSVPTAAVRSRRSPRVGYADLRPVHRQRQRHRAARRSTNNIIPAESHRPDGAEAARAPAAAQPAKRRRVHPETNNYFVQAPFVLNRWTLDSKVNWNATSKLNVFGRFSVLDFFTENGTNFGQELQGAPLGSSNPGTGDGNTYNVSGGATYSLSNNLVMDAHFGFVRMNTGVQQSDLGEFKGLQVLGLPGTNGPNFYEGGTPLFDLDTYADLGTTDTFMPYFRSDDQYQAVMNVNWVKGGHNVRFGTDIYYQALNHTQPEISGGDSFGARGGFRYQGGPTQILGGPGGNLYNAFGVVPARRTEPNRTPETGRALHDAQLAVQPLCPRPVAGIVEDHDLVRHAVGVLPGADARGPRTRTLQRRHQPDDDRRRRLGAERSRSARQQDVVRAARRHDVSAHGGSRAARRFRHHERSVLARPPAAHESSGGAEPAARRAEFAGLRQPDVATASR